MSNQFGNSSYLTGIQSMQFFCLAEKEGKGSVLYFVRTDHIGCPVFGSRGGGTGVIDWTASYLPFGGVETSTGNPIELHIPPLALASMC